MSNLKVVKFLLAAVVLAGPATPAMAQAPAPPPLTMKQLKPNVWAALGGAGGNSTIFIGQNGVVVVDAKQTEAGAKDLLAEIAKITPKPVTTVILTHSDGDHVNGLVAFPPNVKVVAHENNRREQEAAIKAGGRGVPPERLPTEFPRYYVTGQGMPMADKVSMTFEGMAFDIYYFDPAHTSGDLAVSLPTARVVATGDLITTNRADDNPNIHLEKRGSSLGWLNAARGLAEINAEIYVTGHGDTVTKADIERKRAATLARRQKIAQMMEQKKTLAEIKAALPETPVPGAPAPAAGAPAPKTFTDTVFEELTF